MKQWYEPKLLLAYLPALTVALVRGSWKYAVTIIIGGLLILCYAQGFNHLRGTYTYAKFGTILVSLVFFILAFGAPK